MRTETSPHLSGTYWPGSRVLHTPRGTPGSPAGPSTRPGACRLMTRRGSHVPALPWEGEKPTRSGEERLRPWRSGARPSSASKAYAASGLTQVAAKQSSWRPSSSLRNRVHLLWMPCALVALKISNCGCSAGRPCWEADRGGTRSWLSLHGVQARTWVTAAQAPVFHGETRRRGRNPRVGGGADGLPPGERAGGSPEGCKALAAQDPCAGPAQGP